MFRKLLASTALAAVMATGAYAQDTQEMQKSDGTMQQDTMQQGGKDMKSMPAQERGVFSEEDSAKMESKDGYYTSSEGQILATDLIGKSVYNGTGDEAEAIGDVNDIILAQDGEAEAIVIGVGGFLGLGEKDVAVDFDQVKWVERDGQSWLVIAATKEQLEAAPAYEPSKDNADAGDTMKQTDDTAMAPADDQQDTAMTEPDATKSEDGSMVSSDDQTAVYDEPATKADEQAAAESPATSTEDPHQQASADKQSSDEDTVRDEVAELNAPAMTRDDVAAEDPNKEETLTVAEGSISADELIGTTVYGANDENLGEVGDVIVDADEKIQAFIIDVGGFLGLGEKPVAIDPASVEIMKNGEGEYAVHTKFSEDQLESHLAYSEEAWTNDRESVLIH